MLTCPGTVTSDFPNGSTIKGFHLVWEWTYCLDQRYRHFLNENEGKFLLLLPLALQPTVGFSLSNNTSPFFPIYHQLCPSSHSQHLKLQWKGKVKMLACPGTVTSDLPNGSTIKGFHLVWEWAYCLDQSYRHFLNENEGKFLLLLLLALQPAVGFGLSNNTSPFFPIYHQLCPSSHSQHLKKGKFKIKLCYFLAFLWRAE